ncbi:hypothetical protein [Rhodopila sp.]|jgi:hypothetical protein|uniref:hypothetical protein n=1 Tax=Rhodopila sp. TaxID=2480087 RepID=UPI002B548E9E|nr:hypothetical protein [Rhodopila sp.]HVZ10187.1 hypothetical protein [Rhodopila sp.]
MSTTIGAIASALPATPVTIGATATTPGNAARERGHLDDSGGPAGGDNDPGADGVGIVPAPIQPLSNRMLAVFMQQDIELHGSMVG